jgi:protein TonB
MSFAENALWTNPVPRRGIGMTLVVLFHLGLLFAIANGLNLSGLTVNQPPTQVRVIVPTPTQIPLPVQTPPHVTFVSAQPPLTMPPVLIDSAAPSERVVMADPAGSISSEPTVIEPVIQRAQLDPRHPLTRPNYPAAARRMGEHGTVELQLYVLANGRVGDARVVRSSGSSRLDEAAVQEALRAWRLLPIRENGVAVAGWSNIAITFRLTDK